MKIYVFRRSKAGGPTEIRVTDSMPKAIALAEEGAGLGYCVDVLVTEEEGEIAENKSFVSMDN